MSEKKDEKVLENLKVLFEIVFKKERSESYRDIFREVYGDDYPEEANPDSFVTITDLRTIAKNLNVGPGKTFIDFSLVKLSFKHIPCNFNFFRKIFHQF